MDYKKMYKVAARLKHTLQQPSRVGDYVTLMARYNSLRQQKKDLEAKLSECSALYQNFLDNKQHEEANEAQKNCLELSEQLNILQNDINYFMKTNYKFK